jgi:hypothetical protein
MSSAISYEKVLRELFALGQQFHECPLECKELFQNGNSVKIYHYLHDYGITVKSIQINGTIYLYSDELLDWLADRFGDLIHRAEKEPKEYMNYEVSKSSYIQELIMNFDSTKQYSILQKILINLCFCDKKSFRENCCVVLSLKIQISKEEKMCNCSEEMYSKKSFCFEHDDFSGRIFSYKRRYLH